MTTSLTPWGAQRDRLRDALLRFVRVFAGADESTPEVEAEIARSGMDVPDAREARFFAVWLEAVDALGLKPNNALDADFYAAVSGAALTDPEAQP